MSIRTLRLNTDSPPAIKGASATARTKPATLETGLVVQVPEHIDTGSKSLLFERAVAEGVLYVPGEYCFAPLGEPVQRNTIRLSFGVQSREKIREGIASLARAILAVA